MGFFRGKKNKVVREIEGVAWGHLVHEHEVDVDTLANKLRWVEKAGFLENGIPVKFLRIFDQIEVQQRGITVTGWETFDTYPELISFEGYMTRTGGNEKTYLERKNTKGS